ncbi:HEAT repeat domain-containing protein [Streptomyces sp. NPDC053086]|uniref:HEAT repeat domain-containing protein n=1 Tax=unclassified Streptomyces TaxID=2593676 RepID=UPI0037D7CF35
MQEVVPINTINVTPQNARVVKALSAEDSSIRLQAALAVGSSADPMFLETLVERCAVEPDFFVRDMLSWALTRLSPEITLPRIRQELGSERGQARGQALHTLSKIGDRSTWAWITRDLLRDADDEVARTAWRVAVVLVPEDEEQDLADELVLHLGRGDRNVRLSLSRALVDLGEVIKPALQRAAENPDPAVAAHARATELLRQNPETGFDAAIEEAKRVVTLGAERAAAAAVASADTEPSETGVTAERLETGGVERLETGDFAETAGTVETGETSETGVTDGTVETGETSVTAEVRGMDELAGTTETMVPTESTEAADAVETWEAADC